MTSREPTKLPQTSCTTLKGPMFVRLAAATASLLLLTACAPVAPQAGPTGTPSASQSQPQNNGNGNKTPKPTSSSAAPIVKDDLYNFLNHLATSCIFAKGVGVTETISSNTRGPEGNLFMVDPKEAVSGYTAGWVPAEGNAEVILETDPFEVCAVANMDTLARAQGVDMHKKVRVIFDEVANTYTVKINMGDYQRTATYQIGDGGIIYTVTSTGADGRLITSKIRYGQPTADLVTPWKAAVAVMAGI